MRERVRAEIVAIAPVDETERQHVREALEWIDSGAELFRIAKPATPPKHLVSYFALVDDGHILLVDHRDAGLWLPSGGHVEPGEDPRATVERELAEELGVRAGHPVDAPLMLTCTTTVGASAGHTDVSLWYVVRHSRERRLTADDGEFNAVRWFAFSDVPLERSDPHLGRFIAKLRAAGRAGGAHSAASRAAASRSGGPNQTP
jgi:8-oxo-dGTP pyrophosphatase MutT (NUDIX family)